MVKVSVIVPVYNAETTIEDCLRNLVNQTLKEIELILVNDCSTDRSLDYLLAFEQYFPDKIKIINLEENLGPGGARNVGLSYATGEYVGFVDSDDLLVVEMFEKLYSKAEETGADIVECAFLDDETEKVIMCTADEYTGQLDDRKKNGIVAIGGYLVTRIFKRILWDGVKMREHSILEDLEPLILVVLKAHSLEKVPECLYRYRATEGSLSKPQDPEKYHKAITDAMDAIETVVIGHDGYEGIKEAVDYRLFMLAIHGLTNIDNMSNGLSSTRRRQMKSDLSARLKKMMSMQLTENKTLMKMTDSESRLIIGELLSLNIIVFSN